MGKEAIDHIKTDYDWEKAFGFGNTDEYCGDDTVCTYKSHVTAAVDGDTVSINHVHRSNIKEVVAYSDGENDIRSWIALFLVNDGRYAFLDAGCDYTGWD